MKRLLLLIVVLSGLLTACGSGTLDSVEKTSAAEESVTQDASASTAEADALDVLYFKKLGDSSIMVSCYTDKGIALMGGDYFVVHVGDAEICNMDGEKIALDQIVRGSELQIEWPGMVMESYPAQISAETVRVISEEVGEGFPPEDDIPALFGGPKWWEDDPVLEVPDMSVTYWTDLATVTVCVSPYNGTWHYTEEGYDNEVVGGEENALVDGSHPLDWIYDDNNTIKKQPRMYPRGDTLDSPEGADPDKQYVSIAPYPNTKTLTVTAYTVGDESRKGIPVPILEGGNIELLSGDTVYVVEASWDEERYQGSAVYSFLVTEDD